MIVGSKVCFRPIDHQDLPWFAARLDDPQVDVGLTVVLPLSVVDEEACYNEKAGFVHESCKRQAIYKNGEYLDILIMSVLRSEWEE
jgi:hypothetical protein